MSVNASPADIHKLPPSSQSGFSKHRERQENKHAASTLRNTESPGQSSTEETVSTSANGSSPSPSPRVGALVLKGKPCPNLDDSGFSAEAKSNRNRLLIASVVCALFMVGEVVGGVLANSLAIQTDAAHLFSDLVGFLISLTAIWIAQRPATKKLSWGFHRAEILGAILSVFLIWILTGILVYEAVQRILDPPEVDGKIMMIVAGAGIGANILMAFTLHGHGHSHGLGGGHGHSHGGADNHGHSEDEGDSHKYHDDEHDHHTHEDGHGHSHGDSSDHEAHGHSHPHHDDTSEHDHDGEHSHEAEHLLSKSQKGHSHKKRASWFRRPRKHTHGHGHGHGKHRSKSNASRKEEIEAKAETNLNVRAAFIHVIGDLVQSIGVMIAAVLIYINPEWKLADPICTFAFSVLVLFTTFSLLKDATHVLMEGTPRNIDPSRVIHLLENIPGVTRVHDLHIWSLTPGKAALAVHIEISESVASQEVLHEAQHIVCTRFNIHHATIQVEEQHVGGGQASHCQPHFCTSGFNSASPVAVVVQTPLPEPLHAQPQTTETSTVASATPVNLLD